MCGGPKRNREHERAVSQAALAAYEVEVQERMGGLMMSGEASDWQEFEALQEAWTANLRWRLPEVDVALKVANSEKEREFLEGVREQVEGKRRPLTQSQAAWLANILRRA